VTGKARGKGYPARLYSLDILFFRIAQFARITVKPKSYPWLINRVHRQVVHILFVRRLLLIRSIRIFYRENTQHPSFSGVNPNSWTVG